MCIRLMTGVCFAAVLVIGGCAGQPLTLVNAFTLSESNFEIGERIPQSRFSTKDEIRVAAYVTWPDAANGNGQHDVEWDWLRDGVLVSRTRRENLEFESTPYELWSKRVAAALGPGHYNVVDGRTIASPGFTINPN